MKQTKCRYCNKEFLAREADLKRGKSIFCSLSCSSRYKASLFENPTPNYKCAYCKTPIYITPSRRKRSKSELYFCSRQHKDLAARISSGIGFTNHPGATHFYTYRSLVSIEFCNRCGYKKYPQILQVHHKDKNRTNNTKENLEVLCPNCHAIEHKINSP